MREILFKAKRIDDGRWESGCYVKETKWCHIADNYVKVEKHYICVNMASSESSYIAKAEVVPETICQYTGLTDKNGNKIWENDVVEFEDVGEEGYEYKEGFDFTNRAKVEFTEGRWSLTDFAEENSAVVYEMFNHEEFKELWKYCKVIGTAFDNPELMNTTETIGYADNGGLMSAT